MKMLPVKYWDFWCWAMLACALLNVVYLFVGFGVLNFVTSVVFGSVCGYSFFQRVFHK